MALKHSEHRPRLGRWVASGSTHSSASGSIRYIASGTSTGKNWSRSPCTSNVGAEAYVYGERGHLEVNSQSPTLTVFHAGAEHGREVVLDRPDYAETFARSVLDFARSATGQKQPTMPGTDGLMDLRVVEAAYRSVRSGREEAV